MIDNVDDRSFDEIAEAKRQGHKFMKIYLHPSKIGRNQKRIIISGGVALKGFPQGTDNYGSETYTFVERRGDSMYFDFSREEREYICWLYDDPGVGYFSETGYNRDLLASHFEEDWFIIKDAELYADVKMRNEYRKSVGGKKYQKKSSGKSLDTVEALENEINYLKNRQGILIKTENQKIEEQKKKDVAVKKIMAKNQKVKTVKKEPVTTDA